MYGYAADRTVFSIILTRQKCQKVVPEMNASMRLLQRAPSLLARQECVQSRAFVYAIRLNSSAAAAPQMNSSVEISNYEKLRYSLSRILY